MTPHVKLLGLLQLVWGGMGLLLGASLLLLAVGAAAIAYSVHADAFTATFTAMLFVVFAVALGLGGWVNTWVGRGLRRHRQTARTGALAISVVNLFVLPFGTALAIYTYWVLLHNDVRALFAGDSADDADYPTRHIS
jgi:hypothetical protein